MLFLIKLYQYLSPLRTLLLTTIGINPHACRHSPSCSQYTRQAILKYGTIPGLWLGFKRILSCY